jgi:conjugal transfer pilus assembly protein TraB
MKPVMHAPAMHAPAMHAPGKAIALLATVSATAVLALLVFGAAQSQGAPEEAPEPPPPANFGSSVPNERFLQSFQQQLAQQMQSSLAQSAQTQDEKMRELAQSQKALDGQLQVMQERLGPGTPDGAARLSEANSGTATEAPQVNSRRPSPGREPGEAFAVESPSHRGEGPLAGHDGKLAPAPGATDSAAEWSGSPWDTAAPPLGASGGAPHLANIAPHGFIEGRMLNGVVAVLGGPDRESVVALSGRYQSANGFESNLDGCFALVQGRPELAAGRIDFKLSRLTCNFPDGASRTWDAAGWVVDHDGIRGVRALIVQNAGRKLAVAAAAGGVAGFGQRLSQEQYQVGTGPGWGPSAAFAGSSARDAAGGAASSAANALGQALNEYYGLYTPSLQVGGGTPVTIVLANDLRLPSSGASLSQTHVANP